MRKGLLKLLLAATIGFGSLAPVSAYDFEKNGVYYNIISGTTNVAVTYKDTKYASYSGDVVIPGTVENEGVTYTVTQLGKYSIRNSAELTSISLPETLVSIEMGSFSKCNKLTKLTIPNSVTTIGNLAIQDNPALEEITFGAGIETMGTGAFMGDVALKNIEIPSKLQALQSNVFANCLSLTKVNIPANITSVNGGAFQGCLALTDFNVNAANTNYTDIEGVLYSKDKTTLCVYPGGRSASEYTVPEGVKELGFLAFGQHYISVGTTLVQDDMLKKVNLPSTLVKLGNSAFQNLVALSSITIPENVNWIGNATFRGCSALTEIVVPDAVTTLDSYAFQSCTALKEIVLGSGLTTVNASVFKADAALKKVTCRAAVPPVCKSTSFDATVSDAELLVPAGTADAYKSAEGWKLFGKITELPSAEVENINSADSNTMVEVYDVNGTRLASPKEGLNIIRMADGSIRKMIIK